MFSKSRFLVRAAAVAVVGLLGLASGAAQATIVTSAGCSGSTFCTLDELVSGETIQVDDKLFSVWTIEVNNFSDFTTVDLADIDVTGLDDQPLNPGLSFTANNGALFADSFFGDFIDLRFDFDVTVLFGPLLIKDIELELVDFDVDGGGSVQIDETAFELGFGPSLASLQVLADGTFGGDILVDSADFPPQTGITVEKDIFIDAANGDAELFEFTQRFSQIQVPEPGTLAIFGLGLVGLGFMRRRKAA